jgi:hypothetical protein
VGWLVGDRHGLSISHGLGWGYSPMYSAAARAVGCGLVGAVGIPTLVAWQGSDGKGAGVQTATTAAAASDRENADRAAVRQLGGPAVVMVTRTGKGWRAEVVALGVVRKARSLHGLHRQVHELLGTEAVDYEFRTGDAELDRLVRQVRLARAAIQLQEQRAQKLTGQVLTLPNGGSVRDLGILLGLSHQRVHQLLHQLLHQRLLRRPATIERGATG